MTHEQIIDLAKAGGIVLAFITGAYICYQTRFRIK